MKVLQDPHLPYPVQAVDSMAAEAASGNSAEDYNTVVAEVSDNSAVAEFDSPAVVVFVAELPDNPAEAESVSKAPDNPAGVADQVGCFVPVDYNSCLNCRLP